MIIGVIGAGLPGLIAGKTLAEAGHEVTVFDTNTAPGGRMITDHSDKNPGLIFDFGSTHFMAEGEEFNLFLKELEQKGLVEPWGDRFSLHTGETLHERYPGNEYKSGYIATDGMESITRHLSRHLDFRLGVQVSSLTFIGSNRLAKRNWMISLTDANVMELDAIVIAVPAIQANGLIQTSQDETPVKRLMQTILQVDYEPGFALSADYGKRDIPSWQAMVCQDGNLELIVNENSKRQNSEALGLVIKSTGDFAKKHKDSDPETVAEIMLKKAGIMAGTWAARPDWHRLHMWQYNKPLNTLNQPYLEIQNHSAPVALVGDYFGSNTMESSYLSGLKLGNLWVKKYALEAV